MTRSLSPAPSARALLAGVLAAALALVLAAEPAATEDGLRDGDSERDGGGPSAHVVGGDPTDGVQWPWMAALVDADRDGPPVPFCGASVVAPTWVLTAAHCVADLAPERIAALVGTADLDEAGTALAVERVEVHPGYEGLAPWPNDVALLELGEPADVEPVRLASRADWRASAPGAAGLTLGWGATDADSTQYPSLLHATATPVGSDLSCGEAVGAGFDAAVMLCGGVEGHAPCTGDSGGPLVGPAGDGWQQLGVVSSGTGRCGSDGRDLYVEVATVRPWIAEATAGEVSAGAGTRIDGEDVHATAAALTRSAYAAGQELVFVASSETFADGLVGGALAAPRGPLLLVPAAGELPEPVRGELARLAPSQIVVLGGRSAVGPGVVGELEAIAPVARIAGADRYATAAEVARHWGEASTVFVATGATYPDALATVPLTLGQGPVLLTRRDRVPAATAERLAALAPAEVVVLGGSSAISTAVEDQLGEMAGAEVRRVSGENRYETAAEVALDPSGWPSPSSVYVATGGDFPDALAGGVVAAAHRAPLLLVRPGRVPQATADAIAELAPRRVVVLGNRAALSSEVGDQLHALGVRSARVEWLYDRTSWADDPAE